MKHDLEEINSALKLGDKFLPPEGVVCRIVGGPAAYDVKVHSSRMNKRGVYLRASGCGIGGGEMLVGSWEINKILFVPSEAPPFSEWPRGGEEMKHDLEAIHAALETR